MHARLVFRGCGLGLSRPSAQPLPSPPPPPPQPQPTPVPTTGAEQPWAFRPLFCAASRGDDGVDCVLEAVQPSAGALMRLVYWGGGWMSEDTSTVVPQRQSGYGVQQVSVTINAVFRRFVEPVCPMQKTLSGALHTTAHRPRDRATPPSPGGTQAADNNHVDSPTIPVT